jgi:seryl-tRNA synthetase
MAEFRPGTPEQDEFMAELLGAGLLIESGVAGVLGRGEEFERVLRAFDERVGEAAAGDRAERLSFPPLLPRRQLEDVGYLKSFPHLAGSVFGFEGDEREAAEQAERAGRHEDWSGSQRMTDLVLTPAACYPVYPAIAARGPLGPEGVTVDVGSACVFRHEPSGDPARMQSFRMRELIRIAAPEVVIEWRDGWRDRSLELLAAIGLEVGFDVASDPFFGRSGRLLARSQRAQELKFEVLAPIAGEEPTAIASFNYHQDHFSEAFGIEATGGGVIHTACLGFGMERVVLALLRRHGLRPSQWPHEVREELGLR